MLGGWLLRLLLLVIVIVVLTRAVWRLLSGIVEGATGATRAAPRPRREVQSVPLVRDPVCGTYVVKEKALAVKQGDTIEYFCSEQCRDQYRQRH